MKKLLLIMFLVFGYLYAQVSTRDKNIEVNLQQYDNIFDQISKQRIGPDDKQLSKVKTPFVEENLLRIIRDNNSTKVKRIVFKLYGIFDKKVKINNKWYKLGSKVYSYRIVKIKENSVILKRHKKKIELFLRKKNEKIKITKNI